MPDSTLMPEGFTLAQQTYFNIVVAIMTFLNPLIVKLVDKKSFLDKIPTNYITAFVTVIVAVIAKYALAPDLSSEAMAAVIAAMFTGSTLFARAITSKPKT